MVIPIRRRFLVGGLVAMSRRQFLGEILEPGRPGLQNRGSGLSLLHGSEKTEDPKDEAQQPAVVSVLSSAAARRRLFLTNVVL